MANLHSQSIRDRLEKASEDQIRGWLDKLSRKKNVLLKEVEDLRVAIASTTDSLRTAERGQLERQLEISEVELNRVRQFINIANGYKLRPVLQKLGYQAQEALFKDALWRSDFVSFFIYGPDEGYGQRWLASRLLAEIEAMTIGKRVVITTESVTRKGLLRNNFMALG